ncbi:MAG: hypothetical protein HC896_00595 [Bacteroidales bacterium]|nr:hypothetical protein [Bacteroidales bacterium]
MFYGDTLWNCINIEYTIYNMGSSTKDLAAWEVTRVPAAGITFFPQGMEK